MFKMEEAREFLNGYSKSLDKYLTVKASKVTFKFAGLDITVFNTNNLFLQVEDIEFILTRVEEELKARMTAPAFYYYKDKLVLDGFNLEEAREFLRAARTSPRKKEHVEYADSTIEASYIQYDPEVAAWEKLG